MNNETAIAAQAEWNAFVSQMREDFACYLERPDVRRGIELFTAQMGGLLYQARVGLLQLARILESAEVQQAGANIVAAIGDCVTAAHRGWTALPVSYGYEPFLVRRGNHPVAARAMAQIVVRHGTRVEEERRRRPAVRRAIRVVADPRSKSLAFKRSVNLLLETDQHSTVLQTVFARAHRQELAFIDALTSATAETDEGRRRIRELALEADLAARRGRPVSAASAAHEFLLEAIFEDTPRAYTWSDIDGRCVGPEVEATRLEFDEAEFDPRAASRRLKRKQPRRRTLKK